MLALIINFPCTYVKIQEHGRSKMRRTREEIKADIKGTKINLNSEFIKRVQEKGWFVFI